MTTISIMYISFLKFCFQNSSNIFWNASFRAEKEYRDGFWVVFVVLRRKCFLFLVQTEHVSLSIS